MVISRASQPSLHKVVCLPISLIMLLSCLGVFCLILGELKNFLFFICFNEAFQEVNKFENQVDQSALHGHVENREIPARCKTSLCQCSQTFGYCLCAVSVILSAKSLLDVI